MPAVDWLGRSGPHQLLVAMKAAEVRERLKASLTDESLFEAILSFERRYTGAIQEHRFTIYPCKRGRRPQPTLTGALTETAEGTCIEFKIEMDPMLSAFVVLVPMALFFLGLGILGVLLAGVEIPSVPFFLLLGGIPILLIFGSIGLWQIQVESAKLLEFFLGRLESLDNAGKPREPKTLREPEARS